MPEPELTIPMAKIKGSVGDYLGWGMGSDMGEEAWTADKQRRIDEYTDDGLALCYFRATIDPNNISPHQWSFLTPYVNLVFLQGTRTVELPEDFAGFSDTFLTVTVNGSAGLYSRLVFGSPPYIDQLYAQTSSAAGRPRHAAVRPLSRVTEIRSSNYELFIYPEADTDYVLRGSYNIVPERLKASSPYAYGGAAMSDCIKAACRAAAELKRMNFRMGEGPEWQNYMSCLAAAILRDGQLAPKNLGINRDMSDPSRRNRPRWPGDPYGVIGLAGNLTIDGERPSET